MHELLEKLKTKRTLVVITLFIFVGLALYANTFDNQMFWDDDDGILNNTYIKDWSNFPKFFSESLIAGSGLVSNYWRPLLLTLFSLEWHLWGDNVFGYHLVNTSLHIAAAIMVFLVLQKLFKKTWLAFFAGLIFLIHPLQTEAVSYVSGVADPLSSLFTLLSIWFWFKFRDSGKKFTQSKHYLFSILMYVACLLTKDSAFVAVGAVGLADFFYQPLELKFKTKLLNTLKALWPFLLLTGIYTILRATVLNFQNTFNLYNEENVFTSNLGVRFLTFLKVLSIYFGLMFWPNNLHMERTTELAFNFSDPQVIAGGVILLILLYFAFGRIKRYPIISFGILWFLGLLFPHSNLLVPTAGLLYEHWLYLPMVGIFIAVLWIGYELAINKTTKYALIGLIIVWGITVSVKTIARNRDWQDPITFYNQTLQFNTTYRVLNNLGMAYADAGNEEQAQLTYYRAISLDPNVSVAYHNLGNSYKQAGNRELAIKNFNKAIELQPDFFFSYNALADLYIKEYNYPEARAVLERLVPHTNDPANILLTLMSIAVEERNYPKVVEYLKELKKLIPNNPQIDAEIRKYEELSRLEK